MAGREEEALIEAKRIQKEAISLLKQKINQKIADDNVLYFTDQEISTIDQMCKSTIQKVDSTNSLDELMKSNEAWKFALNSDIEKYKDEPNLNFFRHILLKIAEIFAEIFGPGELKLADEINNFINATIADLEVRASEERVEAAGDIFKESEKEADSFNNDYFKLVAELNKPVSRSKNSASNMGYFSSTKVNLNFLLNNVINDDSMDERHLKNLENLIETKLKDNSVLKSSEGAKDKNGKLKSHIQEQVLSKRQVSHLSNAKNTIKDKLEILRGEKGVSGPSKK